MFLFSPGNDRQWYSPSIPFYGDTTDEYGNYREPGAFIHGPMLREMPYFPNDYSEQQPTPSIIADDSTPDPVVYKVQGKHYGKPLSPYSQRGELTSYAFDNTPYWRYTQFLSQLPKYMIVDASNPLLLSMGATDENGNHNNYTIGAVNNSKFVFQRFDGSWYATTGHAVVDGGTFWQQPASAKDIAFWTSYYPVWDINNRVSTVNLRSPYASENIFTSGMVLRFGWYIPDYEYNVAPYSWNYTGGDPHWHICIYQMHTLDEVDQNGAQHSFKFVPANPYLYYEGATKDLRKWYATNKPEVYGEMDDVYQLKINGAAQRRTIPSELPGQSIGVLSPTKQTPFVWASSLTENFNDEVVLQHSKASVTGYPKITVIPATM